MEKMSEEMINENKAPQNLRLEDMQHKGSYLIVKENDAQRARMTKNCKLKTALSNKKV